MLIPKAPHRQTTDTPSAMAVSNQALNRQRRREKREDQENQIIIVSRQPQKRNNTRGFLIRVLQWLPHKKTPLSGFKSRTQLSTTIEKLLIIQNYSKFFTKPLPLSLLSSLPPPILKVPREEDKRYCHPL